MATPIITSIFPNSSEPDATVSINGTGLDQDVPTVKFGTTTVPYTQYSSTLIVVKAPLLYSGDYPVTVTNRGGTSAPKNFDILPVEPDVDSFSPSGPFLPGDSIDIYGSGFILLTSPTAVLKAAGYNPYPLNIDLYTDIRIGTKIPACPSGTTYEVTVTNGQGGSARLDGPPYVVVGPYNTSTKQVTTDTGLSITNIEYSIDGGTTWLAMPAILYTYHSIQFRATMQNPNHYHNVGFGISVWPQGTSLTSVITNASTYNLASSTPFNLNGSQTIQFRAVLP